MKFLTLIVRRIADHLDAPNICHKCFDPPPTKFGMILNGSQNGFGSRGYLKMNCPKCNDPRAEEMAEEVDIGVGIQKHIFGCDCPVCGILSVCETCGRWDFELCNPKMHRA